MDQPHDRSKRFELLAGCGDDDLVPLANQVLADDPALAVLQEPTPKLVMQRVREPVERRPFNLGEVVVTPAEVELDGERGFAMVPGKRERGGLSAAILDAAVAGDHPASDDIVDTLEAAVARRREERAQAWGEATHTRVAFESMEGQS